MKIMVSLAFVCALFMAAPARSADDAAERFGARPDVTQMSLSPDGKSIAFIRPLEGTGASVIVLDLGADAKLKPVLVSTGQPDRLTHCRWSTATRLVCGVYMINDAGSGQAGFTRMVALDADGSDIEQLSARDTSRALYIRQNGGHVIDWTGDHGNGSVLMTRAFVPEETMGSILGRKQDGLGVDLVDTTTLDRRTVEQPRDSAIDYISDGLGTVRVMGLLPKDDRGYSENQIDYFYRLEGDREWQPLSTMTLSGGQSSGFAPVAVDRASNSIYGFDTNDGNTAIYQIALDGTLNKKLVFARPDVDVDDLIMIGRQDRVVGASYVTEMRHSVFFDPELKALAASLQRALPGLPLVAFVDASADEQQLLLFAGSDVDPGRYYLFDKKSRKLAELLPVRPQLNGITLASVKPITFKAADGTPIPAYLTLPPGSDGKNLPAIVMPHGGPASRDEWGFDWLSQYFANQGFAVLQPQYRGSSGYGDEWFRENGFKSWRVAIGDVNDAGHYLLSSGIAAPGKIGIFGWSYGGYAALQSAVLDPDLFKAIVAVAPVTDFNMLLDESRYMSNRHLVESQIGSGPHLTEGSPLQNASRITAPVLLFHGDLDRNVGVGESRAMADKLEELGRTVTYVEFGGLDHYLEDGGVRAELLRKSSGWFKRAFGSP